MSSITVALFVQAQGLIYCLEQMLNIVRIAERKWMGNAQKRTETHGNARGDEMGNYEKATTMSICINCKNLGGRCSWSRRYIPVEGWEAKRVKRKHAFPPHEYGYKVIRCPQFEREERDKSCINCRHIVLCPLEKQAFYKLSGEQCTEYIEHDK